MSHPIVAEKPEMLAFAEQRAKVRADSEAWREQNGREHEAYRAACLSALENKSTIPPAPQDPNAWRSVETAALDMIAAGEKAWRIEHADELAEEILTREDKILARVAKMVTELDGYVDELGDMRGTLAKLRRDVIGAGSLPCAGVNLELLIGAARRDARLLRQPFPPNRPGVEKLDMRSAPSQQLAPTGASQSVWQRIGER